MTKEQGTIAISVGIATTIMAIVVLIISSINREYMRGYVEKRFDYKLNIYDSTKTKVNQAQYDTIIRSLNEIKYQPHE